VDAVLGYNPSGRTGEGSGPRRRAMWMADGGDIWISELPAAPIKNARREKIGDEEVR
jgi:hypothetical protein